MIAYLTKSIASEGFNQIINFLNGSSIKYALTVNPNIYVSCIKQFWTSVDVKKVNDVTRLQALVDKKKVVITKASIRDSLRLDDAEGNECLPNEDIFTELARMGLVRNVDSPTKFYMYPRFPQLMIKKQVCDLSTHTTKYTSFALTQKVAKGDDDVVHVKDVNVAGVATKRVDAGLPMDLLQKLMDTCRTLLRRVEHLEMDKIAQALEITKLKQRVKKLERRNKLKGRKVESQAEIYKIDLEHGKKVLSMQEEESEPTELQEIVDVVTTTKIITEVVTAASDIITAAKEESKVSLELLSFGVDAAIEIKEKHRVFTAASEDISAARQKMMLLVTPVN
nr:xylulose kinase-1 [Tanacetum cinerariifolium]